MKKFGAALTLTVLVAVALAAGGRTKQPSLVREVMRQKLDHSQKVLEGIAVEDFKLIAENAQAMSALSHAAAWQVFQTPEYIQHSAEFRRSADALTEAAKAKNLDSTALNYVQLTMNCVNCHKYVRGVRVAKLD